jgi:hypothetical protein
MNSLALYALIWKETRQLLGICAAVCICSVLGFLVAGWMDHFTRNSNPLEFFYSIVPATLAPIPIVMAGAAIAVGGERQSGTWQWMTTLPISWQSAFFTKLIITILMAAATGLIIFGIISSIRLAAPSPLSFGIGIDGYDYRLMLYAVPIALLWGIIACLCLAEPMVALLVAAVLTLTQGLIKNYLLSVLISNSAPVDFGYMALATSLETIVLFAVAMACFRRAWWNSEPLLSAWFSRTSARLETQTVNTWGTWTNPNSWYAFQWQAFSSICWPLGLLVLVGIALVLPSIGSTGELYFILIIVITPAILGLFTLLREQTKKQYRFIADRGISPTKFLLARSVLPIAIMLTAAVTLVCLLLVLTTKFTSTPTGTLELLVMLPVAVGLYFSFQLGAMTFANPMLALFAAIAFAFVLFSTIITPVQAGGVYGYFLAVPLSLIALTLPWLLVRRWMQYDQPQLPGIVVASIAAICLTSVAVYPPLRAFSVPRVTLRVANLSTPLPTNPANVRGISIDFDSNRAMLEILNRSPDLTHARAELINSLRQNVDLSDASGGGMSAAGGFEGASGSTAPNVEESTAAANSTVATDPSADPLTIVRTKLDSLLATMNANSEKTSDNFNPWDFGLIAAESADWLAAVIFIGIETNDPELVRKAIDVYCTLVNPRYPAEFSHLIYNAPFNALQTVLTETQSRMSLEMKKILFDRLIQNRPNKDEWIAMYVYLSDIKQKNTNNDKVLSSLSSRFGNRNSMSYGFYNSFEQERTSRVLQLKSATEISHLEYILSQWDAIEQRRPASVNVVNLPFVYDLQDTTRMQNRYNSGYYGTPSFYLYFEEPLHNLNRYLALIGQCAYTSEEEAAQAPAAQAPAADAPAEEK